MQDMIFIHNVRVCEVSHSVSVYVSVWVVGKIKILRSATHS